MMPAAASTSTSGVPAHSATYDQPSSHAISVIWRRTGNRLTSSSESDAGCATRPSTESRQSLKPSHGMPPALEAGGLKPREVIARRRGLVGERPIRDLAAAEFARERLSGEETLRGGRPRLAGPGGGP